MLNNLAARLLNARAPAGRAEPTSCPKGRTSEIPLRPAKVVFPSRFAGRSSGRLNGISLKVIGLAVFFAAAGVWAAPGKPSDKPEDKAAGAADDKMLLAAPTVQWLKIYSLPIYKERWRLEGAVKSLDQDLLRVRQAFAKVGASVVDPAEGSSGSKVRRMTYRCPKESAGLALQELKKIGDFGEPAVRAILEPVSLPEIQAKIAALEADKSAAAAELARLPAISSLVEELLGHLRSVESSLRKPEVEVLFQLSVKEKS